MTRSGLGFFIAPFSVDGECQAIDYWECAELSARWLAVCAEHLARHGASFDAPWNGNLSHISTKMTAVSGAAIVTFKVGGDIAASVVLADGRSPLAESEVLKMFVESVRKVGVSVAAGTSSHPFQRVLSIEERPLMVVVPWPDDAIAEQDHAAVRELSIHLAGAFFC